MVFTASPRRQGEIQIVTLPRHDRLTYGVAKHAKASAMASDDAARAQVGPSGKKRAHGGSFARGGGTRGHTPAWAAPIAAAWGERGGEKRGEGEEKGRRTWESGDRRPGSALPPPSALPPVRLCSVLLSARPALLRPLLRPSGCLLRPIALCSAVCSAVCSVPLLWHPMLICSGLC
jgi:hypothetical protein